MGVWVKKMKRLRSTHWQSQNSYGDVKYSIGNIVTNIIIVYGARWVLDLSGGSLVNYINVQPLCYIPETSTEYQL